MTNADDSEKEIRSSLTIENIQLPEDNLHDSEDEE